jgi:hypothetical protein
MTPVSAICFKVPVNSPAALPGLFRHTSAAAKTQIRIAFSLFPDANASSVSEHSESQNPPSGATDCGIRHLIGPLMQIPPPTFNCGSDTNPAEN